MFITFEGIDFCGKSTQVKLLKDYLEKKNKTVKIIREPGGTEISEKIRKILLDKSNNKMEMETEFLLFSASRAQLVREKIRPYLEKGYYVISDRFHDSSTAYQGFGRGIPVEIISHIHQLAIGETLPAVTFYLDIPVESAELRKMKSRRTELDRIEVSKNNFYDKVRSGYIYLSENEDRIKLIDGTKSIKEIHKQIIDEITQFENKELA